MKRGLTCERRQFRRTNWRGNPKAEISSSTRRSSDNAETSLDTVKHSTVTAQVNRPWTTQLGSSDIPLDPLLDHGANIQEADFQHSMNVPTTFAMERNGETPLNTPTGSLESIHFDTTIREEYFDASLVDMQLTYESFDSGDRYLEWSQIQRDLSPAINVFAHPTQTEMTSLRPSWPFFRCNPGTSTPYPHAQKKTLPNFRHWMTRMRGRPVFFHLLSRAS